MPMQPRPMAETWRPLRPSSRVCILFSFQVLSLRFGKHPLDDGERGAGSRPARIECEVRNDLDDFVARDAVLERLPGVEGELVAAIERDECRNCDEAAIPWAEPGPLPHVVEQHAVTDFCEVRRNVAPRRAHRGAFGHRLLLLVITHLGPPGTCD